MHNSRYNLMTQLIQEQKSLWRIEKHYIPEAGNDDERAFWKAMHADKESHVAELEKLIANK